MDILDTKGLDRICTASSSTIKEKMRGRDNGDPSLVPLLIGKAEEKKLEVQTFVVGQVYKVFMAESISPVKPNLWRTSFR